MITAWDPSCVSTLKLPCTAAARLQGFEAPLAGKPENRSGPDQSERGAPGIRTAGSNSTSRDFAHEALFYRGVDEALAAIGGFVEEGISAGEVTVGLLPGVMLGPLSERLGPRTAQVRLEDADTVARNPARILPLVQDLLDGSPSPVRIAVDLRWAERSVPEQAELCHHEALLNLAFADAEIRMLCAYDAGAVGPEVLSCAEGTHARITSGGQVRESARYRASAARSPDCQKPLSPPPIAVEELPVGDNLSRLRQDVGSSRATAALSSSRREDFVLAIDEAATNALEYGAPPRTVRLWREASHVVGEVTSRGRVEDPLAGRRRPDPRAIRGRGLWIINQLCDLVQLRNVGGASALRLHVRCD